MGRTQAYRNLDTTVMTNNQKLKHLKNLVRISQNHVNKILVLENKMIKDIELLEATINNPINK